jgi:hypothetical protein
MPRLGDHAIVIGCSIAGLVAARVLSIILQTSRSFSVI